MKKTEEQVFLEVKERLDYYRLPTIFPYEALDLLSQILALLDRHALQGKQNKSLNIQKVENEINDALRLEIGKVVKENNKLHMDIHIAQQQIMSLRHNNDKLSIERTGGNRQVELLLKMQKRRQEEIFEELTQVKYKYNELMDLIHQDSEIQRRYIKRLMKHKKLDENQRNQEPLWKESKKGQHQTVTDLETKLNFLHSKLSNREAEILRLQRKIEYDGLNMNKILKDFQNHRTNSKIQALEQQISYLEGQNKKMKGEVNDVRKKGGAKEALRQEVRKNHETINKLAQDNRDLNRKLKQKTFDEEAKSKQGKREVQKAKKVAERKQEQNQKANQEICDLLKKVEFLTNQLDAAKKMVAEQQKRNDANDILIRKIKNAEEGDKILAHYQVQSLKQKSEELESQLQNYIERINELKSQNEYHKQEDKLKNQAIQNLQKIVDQLMKRNNQKGTQPNSFQFQTVSLENTIALRKNLAEMKQHLALAQNDKQKLERQLENLLIRFDHKCQQNGAIIDQLKITKMKVLEMKSNEEQFFVLQREVDSLQSDLKKEQNFRYKIDQLHQQAESDKTRLRKQLQQVTQQFEIYQKKSKSQINTLKLQFNEIQQSNQMLELISKEKDKKVVVLQDHIEELSGKIKLLKEEITVVEDEKVNAIRERIKIEKKYEQLSRVHHQITSLSKNNHDIDDREVHNQVIQYQNEIKRLHQRIVAQNEQLAQLNAYCDTLKADQENLLIENNQLKEDVILFRNKEKKNQYSKFD